MTWTYSGIPSATPLDEIRALSGMTDVKNQLVSDEEIEWALDQFSNKFQVALLVCDMAKARFIAQVDCKVGDLSVSNSQILTNIKEKCKQLQEMAKIYASNRALPFVGGISISGKRALDQDTDAVRPEFRVGQDDTPGSTVKSARFFERDGLP